MNKKFKSLVASCLAVCMIFSACGEVEKSDKDKEKSGNDNSLISSNFDFNFSGLNDVLKYAESSLSTVGDSLSGDINTSVSTDLTVELGEMLTEEIGYDIGTIAISNNAKVKNQMVANDLSLKYNGKSVASLNCVVDSDGVGYVQIPELSDAYLKADLVDLIESEMGTSIDEIMPSSESFEIPEELEKTLEAFDEEKISELFETYIGIIEKHIPDGEKGEDMSGKINDLEYTYETKDYKLDSKIAYDCISDMLNEVKNDKEIAALWNEIVEMQREEAKNSGYYSDEQLEEYYPSFETVIEEYIDSFNAEKDDAYSADDLLIVTVLYDDDRAMGFNVEVDGEGFTVAMIDKKTSFGVGFDSNIDDENIQIGFSVEGEDGKFDGKLAFNTETTDSYGETYGENFEITFDTDVKIIDETTGAFKGDINLEMKIEGESVGLSISSDSTKNKADFSFTVKYNNEDVITIGLVNVVTDATNISLPKGKTYDINNDADMEEYAKSIDTDKFMNDIENALGTDLYNALFGSSSDVDWDYDYDYDYDYDWDDDWNYIA